MALITCSECGREISDKALNCVGCGAPVDQSGSGTGLIVPTSTGFDRATGYFSGTKTLLVRLAVKSVLDIGWKLDSADESSGLVSFTTGMTWGSFSGVSGTIAVQEVSGGFFKIAGTAKQNVRGGQIMAPNLFNEANKKVEKLLERMRQLA